MVAPTYSVEYNQKENIWLIIPIKFLLNVMESRYLCHGLWNVTGSQYVGISLPCLGLREKSPIYFYLNKSKWYMTACNANFYEAMKNGNIQKTSSKRINAYSCIFK